MSSKKVFFIMIGCLVILGLGTVGLLVLGDITLSKQAKKLVDLRLENHLLDEQQTALVQANKDINQYEELEKTVQAVVPQDKDQARVVREIIRIAGQSGIVISSIDFPTSNLGDKQTAKPSGQSSDGGSGGNTGDTGGEAAKPKAKEPAVSQAEPVEGISGVYSLEIVITPDSETPVNYYKFLEFLSRLENNRRTAQVTSVNITPDPEDPANVTFALTINIFIKP